jgi:hypothetical protein
MRAAQHFDTEFPGFFGGASGFDDSDIVESAHDGALFPGIDLSAGALGSVARRQFIGSLVAGCLIAGAAGIMELRPVQTEMTNGHAQAAFVVQNPTFAAPARYEVAAVKQRNIELP